MPQIKRKKSASRTAEADGSKKPAAKGTNFKDLELPDRDHSRLLPQSLHYLNNKRGLQTCSPVQLVVIPSFSTLHDVAVEACTGSGKTLAFLIPVVERLWFKILSVAKSEETLDIPVGSTLTLACFGALVMAPSRELVTQIATEIKGLIAAYKEWEESYVKETPSDSDMEKYEIIKYRPATRLFSLVFSGGRGLKDDKDLLRRVSERQAKTCNDVSLGVLCITAGRLRSHLTSEDSNSLTVNVEWTFKTLEVLVIDEADRFFNDAASKAQLMDCLNSLPRQRRTGIFSATLTREYQSLEDCGLRNPLVIRLSINKEVLPPAKRSKVESDSTKESILSDESGDDENEPPAAAISTTTHQLPARLTNLYVTLEYTQKLAFLLKVLNTFEGNRAIIFFTNCAMVNFYQSILSELILANSKSKSEPIYLDSKIEWVFAALHGQFGKPKRRKAIRVFSSPITNPTEKRILLASDLGARGLDFTDVDLVIQFDAPNDPAMCIHRMGRTARAGKTGTAILCLGPQELDYIEYLRTLGVVLSPAVQNEKISACKSWNLPTGSEDTWKWPIDGSITAEDLSVQKPRVTGMGETAAPNEFVTNDECSSLLKWLKVATFRDKDWATKAREAFVSMVRSYKEHRLKFIFVFIKLDYGLLANSLALSRLPRMSELKASPNYPFEEDFCMNFRDVEFHDTRLEARHKNRLMKARTKRSEKLDKLREIKQSKLKSKTQRVTKAKKQIVNALNEAQANKREQRLFSKVKRGLMTETEFDKLVGNDI